VLNYTVPVRRTRSSKDSGFWMIERVTQ
jgi:hypothetical protein